MSARNDYEVAEERRSARVEAGKARLRLAQLVLTAYVDGLGLEATAERIGKSRTVAWRLRVWLGVQSGRQQSGVTGRLDTKARLSEVSP